MVTERWYIILEAAELPPDRPLGVTRLGERLVLWRHGGAIHATSDRCPHRGASLAMGKVQGGCIACPFHGFEFDGDGKCTRIPEYGANRKPPAAMRTRSYPVREAHGFVWLWWGVVPDTIPEIPWFAELDSSYVWHGFSDDWDTHYTRAVENQLDFTHLPFVHHNSIGRGLPQALGVITESEGDRLKISYDPATYDAKGFFVELIAPNLWRNRLAPGIWAVAAFVPVEGNQTRLYLRFYQNHLRLPLLGWLMCYVANVVNRRILRQDKDVVLAQLPREVDHDIREVLVASDAPIAIWRRWLRTNGKMNVEEEAE